jgi:hypothetical protein
MKRDGSRDGFFRGVLLQCRQHKGLSAAGNARGRPRSPLHLSL